MNCLYIVVPYENASLRVPIWAFEEKDIDFCREYDRALRCTMSFAAMELKKFLERTLDGVSVFFLEQQPKHGFFIDLQVENYTTEKVQKDRLHLAKAELQEDQYIIEPVNSGVKITGTSRAGLLYGAYEFLKFQGWQWITPGETGEIVPQLRDNLVLPEKRIEFKPSMSLRRGFHMEGVSKESEELCLWMARNRLNNIGYRPATGPIAKKLGMYLQAGGHIFEEILNPDNVMPSGRTLWEEHTEWYGLPENGIRKKENALGTQFCVSNEDLMEFLGAALLNLIMNEWKDADQIDVWGFDTWGKTCTCEACTRIGNSSDQTLHFLSAMRQYLDKANAEGKLGHHVNLIMCIYEGTATLQPPMNPIPANLHESGDFVTFFPINRCYAHDLFDDVCEDNRKYHEAIIDWLNCEPSIPLIVCEYYNVSKFEDLPLLFNTRLERDLPAYYKHGVRGMYYMHVPMVNWGMRTVTQNLFAALSWDEALDVPMFVENYYTAWYGPYAPHMKEVYELVERAWKFCAQWRAWASDSVLSALQRWT